MTTQVRSRSTDRRYYGLVEAVVEGVNDPLREGRVQLRFPWFDTNTVSDWCRVCQVYAGNGYGTFWVPEVGDEVVAAFVHGDMRLPIVLGGVYNGVDKPATHRSEQRDEKLLRTRAGHQIVLVDTDGHETIRIVEKSGKNAIEISTRDNAITIEATDGKLILKGNDIEIRAASTLSMTSGGEMSIHAGASLAMTAEQAVNVTGRPINLN